MDTYRNRRGTDPLNLNLGTRQRSVVNFWSGCFTPGTQWIGVPEGAPKPIWIFWKTKKSLVCAGNWTLDRPSTASSLVWECPNSNSKYTQTTLSVTLGQLVSNGSTHMFLQQLHHLQHALFNCAVHSFHHKIRCLWLLILLVHTSETCNI